MKASVESCQIPASIGRKMQYKCDYFQANFQKPKYDVDHVANFFHKPRSETSWYEPKQLDSSIIV